MILGLVIAIIVLLFLWDFVQIVRQEKRLEPIPVVSKIPIFGCCLCMASFRPDNLHIKFGEFIAKYGKSFAGHIFGSSVVVTADPRYIETLISSQHHIDKFVLYNLLRPWLGDGLLLSTGQKWRAMRKNITPAFHFKILERLVEIFDRQSNVLLKNLSKVADGNTILDIYSYIGLVTLDVIAESTMGVTIDAQAHAKSDFVHAIQSVTEAFAHRFMRPHLTIPFMCRILAPKLYVKLQSDIAVLHKFTDNIIQKRSSILNSSNASLTVKPHQGDLCAKPQRALLDILLQTTVNGSPLSDRQIRDEVNTFMFAGHDTTTSAVSFCLYLLSRHSTCQQKLFEELRSYFGDDLQRPITYGDLSSLEYLNCVIKESLRLYPPIPSIGRYLKEDLKLEDAVLPAGTNVIVLIWEVLRDGVLYPDPSRFLPERHLESNFRSNSFTFIPFSAGPRNCIGQRFALLEMKTIIIKILRQYELIEGGEEVQPSINIVLKSKSGINLKITPRAY